MMKYSAIILLGGSSTRFSQDGTNKVYLMIGGKPLFQYSIDAFLSDEDCQEIIIVYNEKDLNILKSYLKNDVKLVSGGINRYDSVLNGVKAASCTYVLVHDGARPNINLTLINRVKEGFKHSECVSLGVPVSDTIKKVDNGIKTISRENLYYMQTPQGSNREALIGVLNKIKEEDKITDDLMAFEKYSSIVPYIVLGDKNNLKVTTIEDYDYLKFLMEKKNV